MMRFQKKIRTIVCLLSLKAHTLSAYFSLYHNDL